MNKESKLSILTIIISILMIICFISIMYINTNIDKTINIGEIDADSIINYDFSKLKGTTYLKYEDDNYTSKFGIDISEFSGEVDFEKLKEFGVEFVYMRLGYRSKKEGLLQLDSCFEEYYENAHKAGLAVGVYFFSQAINEKEASEEANFVLTHIKDKQLSLPVAYDLEMPDESRIRGLNSFVKTQNAITFLDIIKNNNYKVIVYTSESFLDRNYIITELSHYDFWLAQYGTRNPTLPVEFSIWQYSQNNKLDGVESDVDFNIMFMRKDDQY